MPESGAPTPRDRLEWECRLRGRDEVVDACRRLVRRQSVDPEFLLTAGGPGARKFLDGRDHADDYWLRGWGARGLLWVWDGRGLEEVRLALRDDHWRVREMALKVVARHRLGNALTDAAPLCGDPTPRVRQAANRAVILLTQSNA